MLELITQIWLTWLIINIVTLGFWSITVANVLGLEELRKHIMTRIVQVLWLGFFIFSVCLVIKSIWS